MSILSCNHVTLGYDGVPILSDINFAVGQDTYLCIVGENGAGKSTLIKGILGLIRPLSGRIETGDGLKNSEIGYLPQQTDIQKDFPASVFEVVLSGRLNSIGFKPFFTRADRANADKNLELLGISDLKNKSYQELSGGQQQRVLLARALCATKKLLLLDEPVSGLDPAATEELYELISRINREQNIAIIMVSHDMSAALRYSNHLLHLSHRQLYFGKTREYAAEKNGTVKNPIERYLRRELSQAGHAPRVSAPAAAVLPYDASYSAPDSSEEVSHD